MYLKTELFGPDQITLYELSGLQRIEYLDAIVAHVAALEAIPETLPESKKMALFGNLTIRLHAWLVARSLWHQDRTRQVEELLDDVLNQWPPRLINEAAFIVQTLSGIAPGDASDDNAAETPGKS